ncbi:hypothetical protein ACS0TY_011421 [Phlomoides rotata]
MSSQSNNFKESSVSEVVSAMAAGWNARVVVETWSHGGAVTINIGLAVVAHHTGGRHICIVPDEESRSGYVEAMRKSGHPTDVIVGRPEKAMEGLEGVDLAVVDCRSVLCVLGRDDKVCVLCWVC